MPQYRKPRAKRKTGRPTKYRKEYEEMSRKLALLGLTDEKIADLLGVAYSTFNLWKQKHSAFSEALQKGRELAGAEVAASMFQNANGYNCHEERVVLDKEGNPSIMKTTKHYPPNVTAGIFYLKKRFPDLWGDDIGEKQEAGIAELLKVLAGGLPS